MKRETKWSGKTEPLNPRCNHNTKPGYGFAVILFNTYLTLHKISTMEIFMSTAYVQQRFVSHVCTGPTWSQRVLQTVSSACMDLLAGLCHGFLLLCHGWYNDDVTVMLIRTSQNQELSRAERCVVTRVLIGDLRCSFTSLIIIPYVFLHK